MPKDWEGRKAELCQLYITENKPLVEIKNILRGRGFDASIRAYRMKFVEWKFLKYKPRETRDLSKPSHHNISERQERKVSTIQNDEYENTTPPPASLTGQWHEATARRSDEWTIPPNAGLDYLLGLARRDHVMAEGNDVVSITGEDAPKASSVVEYSQHGETVSIGGFEFPKQPKTPAELLTIIPSHKPNIQLYGILATWQSGNAYMDCLTSFLNQNSWSSLFSPCLYALAEDGHLTPIEDDLLSSSLFPVIARFVPSEDRFKVTKILLAKAPSEFSSFCKQLEDFVTRSINFASSFAWIGFICGYFRQNGSEKVDEMCVAAGKVVIVERILRHHKLILLDHESSLCADCRSREAQDLRLEYLEILQTFDSVKSPELDLDVELYKYSLDVTRAIGKHNAAMEQKSYERGLELAKEKQEKYRQIIGKYTNTAPGFFDDHLDALLSAENDFALNSLLSKIMLPASFDSESVNTAQSCSPSTFGSISSISGSAKTFLEPVNPLVSAAYMSHYLSLFKLSRFELLFKEWKPFHSHHSFASFQVLAGFEELDFKPLVDDIAKWVVVTEQQPFMKAIVDGYMHFSANNFTHPSGDHSELKYRLHDPVSKLPNWDKVKRFLLGEDAKYEKRRLSVNPWTMYPECVLRLFGECCLRYIISYLTSESALPGQSPSWKTSPLFIVNCVYQHKAIIDDFSEWGFKVDPSLKSIISDPFIQRRGVD